MYPWCAKAPDICNEIQNVQENTLNTTHKTFHWFKSRIQILFIHFSLFLLTCGWCEKRENAREATPAGKRKSRIITSGAVGPYEPWEAVTGTCHTLSVAIAVVRALGDRICEQGRKQWTINSSSGGHNKGKILKIPQWTTWTWVTPPPFFFLSSSGIRYWCVSHWTAVPRAVPVRAR